MPTRRHFLTATGSALAAAAAVEGQEEAPEKPILSFGLMTDCQYADIPAAGSRFYRESLGKLREAIVEFNKRDLAFTLHLGDFIDRDFKSFDDLAPIAASLKSTLHHALGNHDFDVADELKAKVPARLGLEKGYYRFRQAGFRFLVIDTTEFSVYRYPAADPRTRAARAELDELQATKAAFAKTWNSRAGDAQVRWIEEELKEATAAGEVVLVFGHHPILPVEGHATWNCRELDGLFRRYPCAKAYLNGHNHAGAYQVAEGFHYLTLDGMLNTKEQNAFAHADLYPDRLEITGFGRQESRRLKFL